MKAFPHDPRPHSSRRPHLADLFEEIDVGIEKEGEARGKFIHGQVFPADDILNVFDTIP